MPGNEATARIKINRLLEAASWRFFPEGSAPANIRLEPSVVIKKAGIEAEKALVDSNRELIVRFDGKIQSVLARVWGEETPSAGK